jgi:dTDP-glucose 4,6-dehydratase
MSLLDSTEVGPVNCGTENEISMRDLAELIISLTGSGSDIAFLPRSPDDPEKRRPDLTRARTLLGYEPVVAVEDGLRRTIDYFAARLGVALPA